MELNDRLKLIIRWLIGNNYAATQKLLAEHLGYTESSFSQILNGKVPVSDRFIKKICALDNQISKNWLLTGEGKMLNDDKYLLKDNSAVINGSGNSVVSGEHNKLEVSKCQDELEAAMREIQYLKNIINEKDKRLEEKDKHLADKERLINVLMNK